MTDLTASTQPPEAEQGRGGEWPAPPAAAPEPPQPPIASRASGAAPPATDNRPWGWRDLWRLGGPGAVLVVFGALWLLVALWLVASGAPSAGGTPPEIVIVDPAQPAGDR